MTVSAAPPSPGDARTEHRLPERPVVAALLAGFAVLIVIVAAVIVLILRTQDSSELVAHSLRVELAVADIRLRIDRGETARRGFLIDPDPSFVEPFESNVSPLAELVHDLDRRMAGNPEQTARLRRMGTIVQEEIALMRRSMDDRRRGIMPADFSSDRTRTLVAELRQLGNQVSEAERELLASRLAVLRRDLTAAYTVVGVAAPLLLALAGGTLWMIRRSQRQLQASRNRLARLNDDLEGAVEERTANLRRANEEIQRFAYIVSHDLRSPLVNVMGFTSELEAAAVPIQALIERAEREAPQIVGEEARLAAREDLPEALRFIRASTQKMDRLINAILRLSREGRRTMAPEPIDAGELVAGVVTSLQHRISELGAEIRVEPLPALRSDRVAVEQIFSNLLENALKYLDPERPGRIVVRGRRVERRVLFEIEDNGRGIDPKDHERVFDLFRRSGVQDRPGEGIGLAHVRSLVQRLGGTIDCASELDLGATFRLSLWADLLPEGRTSP